MSALVQRPLATKLPKELSLAVAAARPPRTPTSSTPASTRGPAGPTAPGASSSPSPTRCAPRAPTPTAARRTASRRSTCPATRSPASGGSSTPPSSPATTSSTPPPSPSPGRSSASRAGSSWAPRCPPTGRSAGRDVHAWVEVQLSDGTWYPMAASTFVPAARQDAQRAAAALRGAEGRGAGPAARRRQPALAPPGTRPGAERHRPRQAQEEPVRHRRLAAVAQAPRLRRRPAARSSRRSTSSSCRILKKRRRRRHTTTGPVPARAAWLWRDLVAEARSLGVAVPRRVTRREQALAVDAALAVPVADGSGDPATHRARRGLPGRRVPHAPGGRGRHRRRRCRVRSRRRVRGGRRHGGRHGRRRALGPARPHEPLGAPALRRRPPPPPRPSRARVRGEAHPPPPAPEPPPPRRHPHPCLTLAPPEPHPAPAARSRTRPRLHRTLRRSKCCDHDTYCAVARG